MFKLVQASTEGLASKDKFPFFCDAISPTYIGIEPEPPRSGDFDARLSALDLGSTAVARIISPVNVARRSAAATRIKPDDRLKRSGFRVDLRVPPISTAASKLISARHRAPYAAQVRRNAATLWRCDVWHKTETTSLAGELRSRG
jgi:hypothetical protein